MTPPSSLSSSTPSSSSSSVNTSHDHFVALVIIYLSTLLMRGAFYLSIAIITDPKVYPLSEVERNLVFIAYPLAELLTVSFFGALSDRIGKLPIYMLSFLIDALAVFIFAFITQFFLLLLTSALLGVGIAAQVASSLALVAELSSEEHRGRNMGLYDASTLTGFGLGFGLGFLITEIRYSSSSDSFLGKYLAFLSIDHQYLMMGTALLLILTMLVAFPLLRNQGLPQPLTTASHVGLLEKIRDVLSDPKMQHLLPIWVPVIALYGIVLANAKEIAHDLNLNDINLIIVLAIIFGSILVGFPLQGYLSDKYGRKPFLYLGMVSFAAFVTILRIASSSPDPHALFYASPFLFIVGIGCGAFPPAALALLADVSHKDSLGTSFGGYSIVYGTGLIIGPFMAGISLQLAGLTGLLIVIWFLAVISIYGTWKLPPSMTRPSSE